MLMIQKYFILYLLLSVRILNINAQEDTIKPRDFNLKNNIGIDLGYNQGYIKDNNYSPLNYTQSGIKTSLKYNRYFPNCKNIIAASIDFNLGKMNYEKIIFFKTDYYSGALNLSYLRKIATIQKNKFNFYLGVQYNTRILFIGWKGTEAFSYIGVHGLSSQFSMYYYIHPRHLLSTIISVPILQVLARPPYNGRNDYIIENQDNPTKILFKGKVSSLHNYLALDWHTKYTYNISRRFNITLAYELIYQKSKETSLLIQLQNNIVTGLQIKF